MGDGPIRDRSSIAREICARLIEVCQRVYPWRPCEVWAPTTRSRSATWPANCRDRISDSRVLRSSAFEQLVSQASRGGNCDTSKAMRELEFQSQISFRDGWPAHDQVVWPTMYITLCLLTRNEHSVWRRSIIAARSSREAGFDRIVAIDGGSTMGLWTSIGNEASRSWGEPQGPGRGIPDGFSRTTVRCVHFLFADGKRPSDLPSSTLPEFGRRRGNSVSNDEGSGQRGGPPVSTYA